MPSFSKPFRLVAPGAVLAYGILMMPLAHAQDASIAPASEAAPATAPVPVASASATDTAPRLDLQFRDVEVAQLLDMIGSQFKVDLTVSDDVTGTLKSINLNNKTAEQAIRTVAAAAGLQVRMLDGSYVISKNAPADPNTPAVAPIAPSQPGFPTPAPGGFGSGTIVPGSALPPIGTPGGLPILDSAPTAYGIGDIKLDDTGTNKRRSQTAIRVRNVKASEMAYWLDPAHNPLPVTFQADARNQKAYEDTPAIKPAIGVEAQAILNQAQALNNPLVTPGFNPYFQNRASSQLQPDTEANYQFGGGNRGGGRGGGRGGSSNVTFDLPGDIEQIIAVDPQNILLVAGGTDDDIRRLQEIINVLDRPLRQVEIEAQFVSVNTTDTRSFGIDFNTSQGNFNANTVGLSPSLSATSGGFQVGFVRGNFQATLAALVSRNRAKVLTAPRVTAINNLTASIFQNTNTPIVLTTVQTTSNNSTTTNTGQNLFYLTTQIGLTVTPTINNDDTITVLLSPQLSDTQPVPGSPAPSFTSSQLITVANVRDGDTIALGGLRLKSITRGGSKIPVLGDIPLIGKAFQSRSAIDNDTQLIIFVKATIIRRFGDDEPVPGT